MTPVPADAIYCPACEALAARAELGYIGNDGMIGTTTGLACAACGYIREDLDAPVIPTGHCITIPPGMSAFEWFVLALDRAGCRPRPRGPR
jgi:hypothetical protein